MEKQEWWRSVVDKIVEMFQNSVIIQGSMALCVVLTIVIMILQGKAELLPKEFWLIAGTIVGFYFKAKNDNQVRQIVQDAEVLRDYMARSQPTELQKG